MIVRIAMIAAIALTAACSDGSSESDRRAQAQKYLRKPGDSTLNFQTGQTGVRFSRSREAYQILGAYLFIEAGYPRFLTH